jgi:hypothetical protein
LYPSCSQVVVDRRVSLIVTFATEPPDGTVNVPERLLTVNVPATNWLVVTSVARSVSCACVPSPMGLGDELTR